MHLLSINDIFSHENLQWKEASNCHKLDCRMVAMSPYAAVQLAHHQWISYGFTCRFDVSMIFQDTEECEIRMLIEQCVHMCSSYVRVSKVFSFHLLVGDVHIMLVRWFSHCIEHPFSSEISHLAIFDHQKVIDTINPHQFPLSWFINSINCR